jgi:hypothetical protein
MLWARLGRGVLSRRCRWLLRTEAEQIPVRTGDGPCEVVDQALLVFRILDDVPPGVSLRCDEVDSPVKFEAKSSRHSGARLGAVPVCKEVPKPRADIRQRPTPATRCARLQ